MGTGWRRVFCTTTPRDQETTITDEQSKSQSQTPSPSLVPKLAFLSNPSTPKLRCRTTVTEVIQKSSGEDDLNSPKVECKTVIPKFTSKGPKTLPGSNTSSPRSPFSILKNSLRLSRLQNSCGVCLQRVKRGQGMTIYTAECSHSFHFPCIETHVSKSCGLVCPVCSAAWTDVSLLTIRNTQTHSQTKQDLIQTQNSKQVQLKQQPPSASPPTPVVNLKIKQQNKEIDKRAYDDDEPLMYTTAGICRFVPIPEVDDENDDEVKEFQGFFPNPISSLCKINDVHFRDVEVSLMPDAPVVSVGRSQDAYAVVLRVKAPPPPRMQAHNSNSIYFLDPLHRAPIDLVTVLDVSGTMSGAKLQMMKRAMRLVISSLGSPDRLAIISFSACSKRLMSLRRMTAQGQRVARRIVDRLGCHQGTSVADALRKAAKVLEDRRERNPVATIMLLSDGQYEKVQSSNSNQRRGAFPVSSTRFAHVEIPVHSSSENAFTECVGGLLSVVVQDLRIELGFASGSDPAEISAVYSYNGRPTMLGSKTIPLGDLYAEEERELLVEMRPILGSHHVLSVRCSYRDPANQKMIHGRDQALLIPRAESVGSSTAKIERLRNLFITTRAIAESRLLIENNELSRAHQLLSSSLALLMQSSSPSSVEYVGGLEAVLAEVKWRRQYPVQLGQQQQKNQVFQRRKDVMVTMDDNGEPLTPTSAWRAAEQLAKVAIMKKSFNRVGDLHGFENARF